MREGKEMNKGYAYLASFAFSLMLWYYIVKIAGRLIVLLP